jgi:hypothetical protein
MKMQPATAVILRGTAIRNSTNRRLNVIPDVNIEAPCRMICNNGQVFGVFFQPIGC